MAKKKISELPAGGALNGTELVPIVQTGTTKRITAQDIANLGNASGVEGSGTINNLAKFTASSTIGDSKIYDDGTNVGIETTTAINRFIMSANASIAKIFSFRSNNLPRWAFRVDGTESGANAGANFAIRRYNDAGTFIDAPLSITRSTGAATFSSSVTASSLIKSGGTSSQFLKADGSVDSTTYQASLLSNPDGIVAIQSGAIKIEPTAQTLSLGESYATNLKNYFFTNSYSYAPSPVGYEYAKLIQQDLLNPASLILIPSAYKTSKVACSKPTIDLDFTRSNDTATRVNEYGLIETVLANVPRMDYTDSSSPRLLLEPQRTNVITFSENFDNAAWGKTNATVTANQIASPDGFTNADKLIDNSTSGLHRTLPTVPAAVANTTYVLSCFAKKAELDYVILSAGGSALTGSGGSGADLIASVNLNNGAIVTNNYNISSVDYGNGWYRISIRLTTDVDGGSFFPYIAISQNGTTATYVGSGQGIYLWGGMMEIGATYATSYIPTLGAAVTRGADASSKTGISSLIGQTEGTLFAELIANRTGANQNFELSDGTIVNRINLRLTSLNTYQIIIVQGGVIVYNQTSVATFAQGQTVKIAAAYKSGDSTVVYVNGTSVASATAGTITGNFSAIYTASIGGTTDAINSPVKQTLLFPTRLSNAELATLTTI